MLLPWVEADDAVLFMCVHPNVDNYTHGDVIVYSLSFKLDRERTLNDLPTTV